MKDFYWDIRPKPEYGTVEIRIFDTPLNVDTAAQLAAYAQTLAADLLRQRRTTPIAPLYLVYGFNRFQASRFGFQAMLADPEAPAGARVKLRDDIVATLDRLGPTAANLGTGAALDVIRSQALHERNDARWLREKFAETKSLADVVRLQSACWAESAREPAVMKV
jgi:carboxylate-amine ligase